MSNFFADVAVPVPLPQTFTYSIPTYFENFVQRGSNVVVPFGKKILYGIVVQVHTTLPSIKTKPIFDVVDATPTLTEENMKLAEWLAEYYSAPIGETVRLFLSAGIQHISKRIVSIAKNIDLSIIKSSSHQKIFSVLKSGPLTIEQLRKKTGIKNIYSAVNELSAHGFLAISEELAAKPKLKREWFFKRISDDVNVALKGKLQKETWREILSFSDETSVKNFLQQTPSSLLTLQSLAKKNLISLYKKSVERKHTFAPDEQAQKSLLVHPNDYQTKAIESILPTLENSKHVTFLLHGVTGSGKTQVYIELIRKTLQLNKSAIMLVPEISLTPQTVRRFQIHFGDAVIWMHSKMSIGERYDAWRLTKEGKYQIVIGPRSALFAPVQNLGLIVVDEEHESSYKQFDATPRYHARDVAVVRGSLCNAVVLLGSATPSIESYANTLAGKYTLLTLPERADNAQLPPIEIVSMIEERKRLYNEMKLRAKEIGKKAFENASKSISSFLAEKINDRLEKKEGIILLQNRRGFSPYIECNDCGHVEQCDRCSVTMTFHAAKKHLRCHYCGKVKQAPTVCPLCGGFTFSMRGFGTQRVEQELQALFPSAKILRMDLDTTTRKHSHEKILQKFGSGEVDILLGTQMVAKGLDFPRVTLVGVISADTQMMLPDFRSAERTFQLLTQVAGRAGRSTLRGEVIIQTSQPNHYALKHVQDHDFISFYNEEIGYRKSIGYPPYSRIILVEFKGKNEKNIEEIAFQFHKKISSAISHNFILGPSPAVLTKIKNDYRWHIIIKADKEKDKNGTRSRASVARVAQELHKQSSKKKVKIIIDVDPVGML